MKKTWRNIVNTFFSFQRSDRNAILILSIAIVLVYAAILILDRIEFKPETDFSEIKALAEAWENESTEIEEKTTLFEFDPNTISMKRLDSLSIPQNIKNNLLRYRKAGGSFKKMRDVRKIYGMNDTLFAMMEPFIKIEQRITTESTKSDKVVRRPGSLDPNLANEEELTKFGFNEFQRANLIKYRNNGGSFNAPSDLLKIYGIDSAFYDEITGFINIKESDVAIPPRLEEVVKIELNSVDTTGLIKLPGIGSTLAGRIIKYRDLLGGYYTKHQLNEVYKLNEETYVQMHEYVYVDTLLVSKIRINFAGYRDLIKHPYLGSKEVNEILDYRQKHGPIKKISVLCKIEGFDSEFISKIRPYVSCR